MADKLALIPRSDSLPCPTARDIASVFFRQKRVFATCFVIVGTAAMIYGVCSHTYEAQMKIMVRHGRVDPVVTPTPTPSPQFARDAVTEEELNSEVELLRDHDILSAVVQRTGLDQGGPSWFRKVLGETKEAHLARAILSLDKHLSIKPVRKATLISISYRSPDSARASEVLKALSAAYLERHSQVRRASGEFEFFEEQVSMARQTLQHAQVDLLAFTKHEGIVSAALERDLALRKMSETEASAAETRTALGEAAQRISTLEAKVRSLPERVTVQVRNSDNPLLLQKLKSTLLDLELKRTELLTKYSPSYRLVQEVDRQIAEAKGALAAEDQLPLRDETTAPDPNREWAKAELVKAQVEFSALSVRAKAVGSTMAKYRESAQRLGANAPRQEELLRNVKEAEDKYLLYVNKREEARISDALDRGGILNVVVAQPPTVPVLPVRSAWTWGLIGLVLAGMVSTGAAFTADYLDPAFRTPDEVIRYLGAPVLASLPRKDI